MKCPKCGAEVAPSAAACWQCLTPLQAPIPGQPTPVAVPRPMARKPKPWVLAAGVAVVVLAAAGGIYYWMQRTGPAACARAFCQALDKGDSKALKALMSSKDRRGMSGDTFLPPKEMGIKIKAEVLEVTQTGNTAAAKVRMTMTMRGMSTEISLTFPLMMVKEPGGWRVDGQATERERNKAMGGIPADTPEPSYEQPPPPP